jgi:hypothetical protein
VNSAARARRNNLGQILERQRQIDAPRTVPAAVDSQPAFRLARSISAAC